MLATGTVCMSWQGSAVLAAVYQNGRCALALPAGGALLPESVRSCQRCFIYMVHEPIVWPHGAATKGFLLRGLLLGA